MKKISQLLFIIMLTIAAVSCKKEAVTVSEPSALSSRNITIKFPSSYVGGNCVLGSGICIIWDRPRAEWANYHLSTDEAKGEAWASNADSGRSQIKYYLSETNLSPALYDKMVLQKKYTFANDNEVPTDLITKTYKDAGIAEAPSQLKILKGDYPVTVVGTPGPSKQIKIEITINHERKTGKITILIVVTITP